MISVEKLKYWANKKEKENYRFRTFLKINAEPDKLDEQFKQLHKKYFAEYDCSSCRNCCKEYCGTIPNEDVEADAEFLGLDKSDFIMKYLVDEPNNEGYNTRNKPCDFLQNNVCILEEHKPDSCKNYPYTDREDRIGSLLSIIDNTSICPVVYEIMEDLKSMYNFR